VSKRKRELSGEEKRLWRRVAETVQTQKPLPEAPLDAAESKPARGVAVAVAAPPKPAPAAKRIARAPADRGGEKRVRRGRLDVDASFDLHGHTLASGRAALVHFIDAAFARGDRTLIVITGVGRSGEGVLRRALPEWLAAPEIRPLIAGYAQAHRSHGGAGAYYVFLKRAETSD